MAAVCEQPRVSTLTIVLSLAPHIVVPPLLDLDRIGNNPLYRVGQIAAIAEQASSTSL